MDVLKWLHDTFGFDVPKGGIFGSGSSTSGGSTGATGSPPPSKSTGISPVSAWLSPCPGESQLTIGNALTGKFTFSPEKAVINAFMLILLIVGIIGLIYQPVKQQTEQVVDIAEKAAPAVAA